MTTLADGQSELDSVVLSLPDYGQQIKNWSSYTLNRAFLAPTASWSFTLSDEDQTLTNQLLVPGATVALSINGNLQCTGVIEEDSGQSTPGGGTSITIHGGDVLSRVVKATMDPTFKFVAGATVAQFVLTVLDPFGITTLFNSDIANLNIISGYAGNGGVTTTTVNASVVKTITNNPAGGSAPAIINSTVDARTSVTSTTRPDLSTLTLQQAKPHAGEGCFAYIDRILKRLGLTIWATADGTGVVVDQPNYSSAPNYKITYSRSDPSQNNVKHAARSRRLFAQPSCIFATGFGGGQDVQKSRLKCIQINELTGLDSSGAILPSVQAIIARYPGAKVLPLRPQLAGFPKPLGDKGLAMPLFMKDDEAKNIDQLAAFVRREMAKKQLDGLQMSYEVEGHTQNGHPWAVNTQVSVADEVWGVNETMWVMDVTFSKSPGGGTVTALKLIRPYTLVLSA